MSRGVKTIVGVAAAIAIPFAAPAIAGAIGASLGISAASMGMSAAVGSVLGSAAVGAGLGAATSAALGQNVGRGALLGGIGGGIGGYTSAANAATAATAAPSAGAPGLPSMGGGTGLTMGGGSTGLTLPTGAAPGGLSTGGATGIASGFTPSALAPMDYSLTAGMQFPTMGLDPSAAGVGLRAPDPGFFASAADRALTAGTPVDYSLAAGMPSQGQGISVAAASPTGGTQMLTGQGAFASTTPAAAYAGGGYSPTLAAMSAPGGATAGTATAAAGRPTTFVEALKQVPSNIAARFSDPQALADLTLRAAGQLAGSALAGDGLSSEERGLLDAQTEELRTLQQQNQSLFNQRLEQAQALIGESKYFDPEYFGLQRARRAQITGARAKQAGLRGLTGGARQAEGRRFDLATGRDTGTAYDVGFGTGVAGRLQTQQAGLSMFPQAYPGSFNEYGNISRAYGQAAARRDVEARNIGSLFGSLTGRADSEKNARA